MSVKHVIVDGSNIATEGREAPSLAQLDEAVTAAAEARLDNTGQSCNAAKRFIVVDDLYDEFLAKFKEELEGAKPGDPTAVLQAGVDSGSSMGMSAVARIVGGESVGANTYRLRWQLVDGFAPFSALCAFLRGLMAMVPTVFGLAAADVLLWIGDNIQDFPRLRQDVRSANDSAFAEFGDRFIVLPNPMYGSWERNALP